jgi:hypothetical protein
MVKRDYHAGYWLRGLVAIGAVSLVLLGASTGVRSQEIRVRFLDGRTGRPVTYEAAQVWVGTSTEFLVAPAKNKEGVATFLYTGHSIKSVWPPNTNESGYARELTIPPGLERIAVAPSIAAGICWDLGPSHLGPWYEISDILKHGAVPENRCGSATAKAKPGELILFIEPLSIWKRLLDGFRS